MTTKFPLPPSPLSYQQRYYRSNTDSAGLISFNVQIMESDLHIMAEMDVRHEVRNLIVKYRNQLTSYGLKYNNFLTSLLPLPVDQTAPPLIRKMQAATVAAGVGPMAAVAGGIAEFIGKDLLAGGVCEVIIENGGDIFLYREQECVVSVFAGLSSFSNKVGLKIACKDMPLGICTSSGRVGHSLSFGQADAVTVVAASATLADAVATRLGNEIKDNMEIKHGLAIAATIDNIMGVVIVKDNQLGVKGEIELVPL